MENNKIKNDHEGQCTICCQPMKKSDKNVSTIISKEKEKECLHKFHLECIDSWAKISNSCPLCRAYFSYTSCEGRKKFYPDKQQKQEDHLTNDAINTLHSVCTICGSGDLEEVLLICDGCDALYHTFCVGLSEVPSDDWFCAECVPNIDSYDPSFVVEEENADENDDEFVLSNTDEDSDIESIESQNDEDYKEEKKRKPLPRIIDSDDESLEEIQLVSTLKRKRSEDLMDSNNIKRRRLNYRKKQEQQKNDLLQEVIQKRAKKEDEWKCKQCTFLNTRYASKCEICETKRILDLSVESYFGDNTKTYKYSKKNPYRNTVGSRKNENVLSMKDIIGDEILDKFGFESESLISLPDKIEEIQNNGFDRLEKRMNEFAFDGDDELNSKPKVSLKNVLSQKGLEL